jgi:hypothetical protein
MKQILLKNPVLFPKNVLFGGVLKKQLNNLVAWWFIIVMLQCCDVHMVDFHQEEFLTFLLMSVTDLT